MEIVCIWLTNVFTYLVVIWILKKMFTSIFLPSYGRLSSRLCITHHTAVVNTVLIIYVDNYHIPATYYCKTMCSVDDVLTCELGASCAPYKLYIAFSWSNDAVGVQFLKDVGIIPSSRKCFKCGSQISWRVNFIVKDDYRWRYLRTISVSAYRALTSIRHGIWFQQRNLKFMLVLLLTYDIVQIVAAHNIRRVIQFGFSTIKKWNKVCREFMLDCVLGSSQKIGGPNETVEIKESNFRRRKCNRGHKVKEQWVLGGVVCDSGKYISSSRSGQNRRHIDGCSSWLDRTRHYSYEWLLDLNHTISFVDVRTGARTNILESTWRHIKAFHNPYNRMGDNIYHLAQYLFAEGCRTEKAEQFTMFMGIAGEPHLPSVTVMSPSDSPSPHHWCTVASHNG